MLNIDVDSNFLINKLKKKLIQDKKTINDNIRGYAEKLEKYKNKLIKKYKIKKDDTYKLGYYKYPYNKSRDKFYKNIHEDLLEIQKIK